MSSNVFVSVLEHFSMDFISAVIPGSILLVVLDELAWSVFGLQLDLRYFESEAVALIILLGISFILGHLLISVGNALGRPVRASLNVLSMRGRLWQQLPNSKQISDEVSAMPTYQAFLGTLAKSNTPFENELGWREARNIAMTQISSEDRFTVVRFMFINLFCLSSFACLFLIGILLFFAYGSEDGTSPLLLVAGAALIGCSMLLLIRSFEFKTRAYKVPFQMAYARNFGKTFNDQE